MKALIRLSPVWLLLGLAWSVGWGQSLHHQGVGAPGPEAREQPVQVVSGIPVDDLDRGTPRRTVEGFRRAVRARNYGQAAEYLDLRNFPAETA